MLYRMSEMSWQELRDAGAAGATALVPTGSLEQHGHHLPVKTDTALVTAVAEKAAASAAETVDVVLAPTLWLGASHHHLPFFALSVDESTYVAMLTQMGTSLAQGGFRRLFFLNGHGGNSAPLRLAMSQMRRLAPDLWVAVADYWSLGAAEIRQIRTTGPGGMGHACEFETSLMMHIDQDAVREGRRKASVPAWPKGFESDLVASGPVSLGFDWSRVTADGTLGDPTAATPENGERFLAAVVAGAARALVTFGRLQDNLRIE